MKGESLMKTKRKHLAAESILLTKNSPLGKTMWAHRHYYLMLLPAFVVVMLFSYFPIYGVQIAFKNYKGALGIVKSNWVGLKNFKDFFSAYNSWDLIYNTFALSIYSFLISFPIPIIVALLLNEIKGRYKRFIQTILYAPHFISMVVMCGIIIAMLSPSTGPINTIIEMLGGNKTYFMADPNAFRHIYVWSGVWQGMGWSAVIYIAALASVDPQLHEAAIIDGASKLQRIRHINIPTILPTIVILFIMSAGNLASVGQEKVLLLQNDLNLKTSEVISTYVYKRGIVSNSYSFSSAIGLMNNVVNIIFLMTANFISKRVSDTSLF